MGAWATALAPNGITQRSATLTKESYAMADLEALKQKYAGVIESLQKFAPYGATLDAVDLDGEQLHIKGSVPSRVVLERVWDHIKKADPTYSDLHHEIANTGGDTQPYTIKSGDTLSAVSLLFYGNANKYPEIAKANNLADPNKVSVGTTLQLPVIT
jgi:LysM repeat protein